MRMIRWRAPERQTPVAAATETGADEKTLGQAVYALNGITSVAQTIGKVIGYLIDFIVIDLMPIALMAGGWFLLFDVVARYAGVRQ